MIKVKKNDATLLLTLPRNEAAFAALVTTIKNHQAKCVQEFNVLASQSVFQENVRPSALVMSGRVNAINDIVSLLENLTLGDIND